MTRNDEKSFIIDNKSLLTFTKFSPIAYITFSMKHQDLFHHYNLMNLLQNKKENFKKDIFWWMRKKIIKMISLHWEIVHTMMLLQQNFLFEKFRSWGINIVLRRVFFVLYLKKTIFTRYISLVLKTVQPFRKDISYTQFKVSLYGFNNYLYIKEKKLGKIVSYNNKIVPDLFQSIKIQRLSSKDEPNLPQTTNLDHMSRRSLPNLKQTEDQIMV